MADPSADVQLPPATAPARHVALVLGTATPSVGRHVRQLAEGLTQRGSLVSVYAPAAVHEEFGFVDVGARPGVLEIAAEASARDLGAARLLRQALRSNPAGDEVDIVHAHGLRAGLVAGWARPAATPLVVTWHTPVLGGDLRARTLRLAERIVARSAGVSLCASDDLVARVNELGGRDARLAVLAAPTRAPVPRDRPRRSAAQVRTELDATGRPLVLSVGRLHPQKDYPTLVIAAARWRELDPAPVVAIAGTGPAYRSLAGQVLTSRAPVLLLGQRDDVPDLLAAADLAVVTSVWEGRPLFVQEAMAAGVALVATGVGGLPALVGDAVLLVAPADVDALDAAVRALLADAPLRARYAAAGLARSRHWPTAQDTVDQVTSVYAQLLLGARAAAPRRAG